VRFLIAHAAWAPGRAETLAEMLKMLPAGTQVLASERREHSAVWANRAWYFASRIDDHVALLNDDLLLHPDFPAICEAMVSALSDECISLHTQMPEAKALPGPWVCCYWYSGAAVILPPGAARSLLDFPIPWSLSSRVNEDNIAIHWAWAKQKPFWCPIPAPVIHRIDVKSALGYDGHAMRQTSVPWTSFHPRKSLEMCRSEYWGNTDSNPLVPNPWLPDAKLAFMAPLIANGREFCQLCSTNEASVANSEGIGLCKPCVERCAKAVGL
jgi:hypothetical protein